MTLESSQNSNEAQIDNSCDNIITPHILSTRTIVSLTVARGLVLQTSMSRPSHWHRRWRGDGPEGTGERELYRGPPPDEVVVREDCRSDWVGLR